MDGRRVQRESEPVATGFFDREWEGGRVQRKSEPGAVATGFLSVTRRHFSPVPTRTRSLRLPLHASTVHTMEEPSRYRSRFRLPLHASAVHSSSTSPLNNLDLITNLHGSSRLVGDQVLTEQHIPVPVSVTR